MSDATTTMWWNRPSDDLDGRSPTGAWLSGHHLDVERLVDASSRTPSSSVCDAGDGWAPRWRSTLACD
jgi:hypothetical protein